MTDVRGILKTNWGVLKQSFNGWNDDKATTLSAAIAYYTIFSLAPLLIITLAVAGLFYGDEASRGEIFSSIRGMVGTDGAKAIEDMVEASAVKESGIIATIVGVSTLLIGATTVFGQLQDSLNLIWKTKPKPGRGLITLLRQRLLSFSLILAIGFLLLVSLLLSAGLAAIGIYAERYLPGGAVVWKGVNIVVSFGIITALFAAMYKILPDVKLKWKNLWVGAAITSLLFTVGKFLISLYLGQSGISSTYGAAGSAIVVLAWTYYSSAILLLGAEYTKYHSLAEGEVVELKKGAEWMEIPSPLKPEQKETALPGNTQPSPGIGGVVQPAK